MFARVALFAAVSAAGAMAVCNPADHGPFTMGSGSASTMTLSFGVDDADNTMVCHTIGLAVSASNSFQAMCIGQSMTTSSCVVAAEGGAIIPINNPQLRSNTPTSTPVFTADAYTDNGSLRAFGFTRGGYSATAGTNVVFAWNPAGGGTLTAGTNATQASRPHTFQGPGCLNAAAGVFTNGACPVTTGVATTATTGTTTATTATTSTGVASTTGTTTGTTATTSTGVASTTGTTTGTTTGAGNGTGTGNSTTGTGNATAGTTGTTTGNPTTGINPTTGNAASAATSLVAPLALLAAGAAAAAL